MRIEHTLIRAAVALAAALSSAHAADAALDPLAAFSGSWTYVGNQETYGAAQACKDHWEKYAVSANRRDISAATASGKSATYRVLYAEGNAAAMYMDNEDRRNAAGDRIVWMLVMESPDRFRWRIYGDPSNPTEEAKFARIRCK